MPYRDWAYKIVTNENLVERVERGFETEADAEEEALEIMRQKGNENMRYVVYQAPYDDNEDEDEDKVFV